MKIHTGRFGQINLQPYYYYLLLLGVLKSIVIGSCIWLLISPTGRPPMKARR